MPSNDLIVVIDSGTTNSRVRLVKDGTMIGGASEQIGVVETAKTGSNVTLKQGIRRAFEAVLREHRISFQDIHDALGFGMITSELGVLEIPHLIAPVGIQELARSMVRLEGGSHFLPLPVHFIRGVKNRVPSYSQLQSLPSMDFMRGEETQVMGLVTLYKPSLPTLIVILSSHTKLISIDAEGYIQGSVTTLSGQLFAAICRETFVASAVREEPGDPGPAGFFDPAIVEEGYRIVTTSGLTRALLMPRFMHILMKTHWYERRLFLESLLAGEDMRAMQDIINLEFPNPTSIYLVGLPLRCAVYRYLMETHQIFKGPAIEITEPEAIERLGVIGALEIFKRRNSDLI